MSIENWLLITTQSSAYFLSFINCKPEGDIQITYSDWLVNTGLDDRLFKK